MTHRRFSCTAFAWMAFTVLTGAALADSAVQAIRGLGSFAWWHLPTLGVGVLFTSMNLSAADRAFVAALLRLLRMKAAASFLKIRTRVRARAARGLAALFTYPSNRPQTDP